VIAILPMKVHSERVPNKNFRLIAGKPLYVWILENLFKLNFLEKIIINTDANFELFDQFKNNKKLILRSRLEHLRGDHVSMNLIIEDDLKHFQADDYLMTHTTNPNLSPKTLNKAYSLFKERDKNRFDTLFSVTRFQGRFYREDYSAVNHDPSELIRTQDLPPLFLENSCLYMFSREDFFKHNARIGSKPIMFETPQLESIDIDTESDWLIAESVLQKKI
jgi:CMP-N-acetylneuraminic acid synthetase